MTDVEAAVAREIVRVAREELRLEAPPSPPAPPGGEGRGEGGGIAWDEPLASRLDSLQLLALVVAVEDRFHLVLTDDDAAETRTLAQLARLVAARAPAERLPAAPDRAGSGGATVAAERGP
ncbi:MAG TPA: acyl carrier protein [Anaeromyxobacter sp.]|nr:acyl carrier protein [Anaeromyxobacter sp.]